MRRLNALHNTRSSTMHHEYFIVFSIRRIRYNRFDCTHTNDIGSIIRQKSVVAHVGKARSNHSCLMSTAA